MLEAGILVVGCVFAIASLLADLLFSWLNPAHPLRSPRMTDGALQAVDAAVIAVAGAERRQRLRQILRSGAFLIGLAILAFWVFCAIFGSLDRAL